MTHDIPTAASRQIMEIASKHFRIETLESRHSDSLDFHDVSVWSIRAALEAAYLAGVLQQRTE
jgi:hypothetical protein